MPKEKKSIGWRQRFLANRMTFESILFEKELAVVGKDSLAAGVAGALAICLLASLLLAQWVLRQGCFFSAADAAGFHTASAFLEHFKSGGIWNIFKPLVNGFSFPVRPPLYYLTYVPVLKFITSDMNRALILVNSFYLSGLALAIFFAVRKNRSNQSAWLGASFAMALPFVLETARHPDHRLAAMAFAAATYAAYIHSEDFEYPAPSLWFGVFFGLGFFSDTMFWVYALPLVPFIISGLSGQMAGGSILKGLLPGAALSLPWYAFACFSWGLQYLSGTAALTLSRPGIFPYLSGLSGVAGQPLFLIGGLALVWMYFSAFMPYSARKIIAAWFWVPFIVVYMLFGGKAEYMYPALLPMSVAVAVMTPGRVRKYFTGLAVLLLVYGQSGLAWPVTRGGARAAGGPGFSLVRYNVPKLMSELKSRAGGKTASAALIGEEGDFNHVSLNFLSEHSGGTAVKFGVYSPGTLGLADFVVYKTGAFNSPSPEAAAALAGELSRPWFAEAFSQAAFYELPDTSRLIIYEKKKPAAASLQAGKNLLKNIEAGGLHIADGVLTLSGFDPARGVYAGASLLAPYAELEGIDVYGLSLEITDFSAVPDTGSVSGIRITGAKSIRIISARTTGYSLGRYFSGRYPALENLEVRMNETIRFSGAHAGRDLYGEVSFAAKPPILRFRFDSFSYAGYDLPGFILGNFTLEHVLSGLPCEILFNKMKIERQMLVIS
jgi:hypothetical protein